MSMDSKEHRRIMGAFATGVTVVTTVVEGEMHGMTANAVASLSLDPPLVMVSVHKDAHMHDHLTRGKCFAMNILSEDQEDLSTLFATKGRKDFSKLRVKTGVTGAPIFEDALGYVDCTIVNTLPAGDHDIFVGQIEAGDAGEGRPLLFYAGKYGSIAD
jgi:flavin reductase (DIM6/NTAB) family NADH-FMN oxidoreductase RutF